ncbi:MAG: peptide chain release factor N(5)-glutamine methyltransferase [Gammaproteobacteria bacterium]
MLSTIANLLNEGREKLADQDVAELEARLLLAHAMDKNIGFLYAWPERAVPESAVELFRELVLRRARGEPIAHLLGRREFWSLELKISAATLIPRPETERLVELALGLVPPYSQWSLLDLGTGSGAIAIAVARDRPECAMTATDVSNAALDIARENAARHQVNNITFLAGDWFAPVVGQRFHCILSNPPYISINDPYLERGDLQFEDRGALVAGEDGLDAIRHIINSARAHMEPRGWLIIEHGFEQGEAIRALLEQADFETIACHQDLAGLDRVSCARAP